GNDATIESEQSEPQSKATAGNAVGSKAVAPASFGFCIGRLCVQDGFVTVGDERYRLVDNFDIPYRGLWATGHHIYKDKLTVFFETESGSVPTELFASSYRYKVLPLPDFNHFVVF
ncbi:zonula occludens toxin ZOT, partial [Vibrio cholerae]